MTYPAAYAALTQEEMAAVSGGISAEKMINIFNKVIGKQFQDKFLANLRNAVWSSLQSESVQPVLDWCGSFWQMSLFDKVVFLYGGYLVGKTTVDYWKA